MKKTAAILSLFLIPLLFSSCGPLTYITDSWQKPEYKGRKYDKIIVWVIAKESSFARRVVEDRIVSELKAAGINAVPSYDKFGSDIFNGENNADENEGAEKLKAIVKAAGSDGALVLSVKDIKKYKTYVPGFYNGPFSHYYYSTYMSVYSPGYYTTNSQVFFESGLFDLKADELVYSVLSETVNPSSVKDFANSFSSKIVGTMIEQRVIVK